MEDVPYGRILREGWLIIAICAVVCAGLAWGATKALPQTYTASSTLMLQVDSRDATLFERNQFSMARIKTYPDLVDSQVVIDGVREDLGLDEQEYSDRALRGMVSAENIDDTVLLKVVAEASTAELSSDLANSAASHLSDLVEVTESDEEDPLNEVTLEQVLMAVPPASATSPNVTAITGLGLIGGFAVGAILAVYRTMTNTRLLTVTDVRRASGLAVVGQIPRTRRSGADPGSPVAVAFQETIGNMVTLGGADGGLYALVPATDADLDDEIVTGLLDAYSMTGARACVVDARATPVASSDAFPVVDLAARGGGPEPLGDMSDAALYTSALPVSSQKALESFVRELDSLREIYDVVLLICDSGSSMLIERIARHDAGLVVVVRHGATQAADLNAIVTRRRVQGIQPLGVLMTHTSRRSTENVAETWRVTDRKALEDWDSGGAASVTVEESFGRVPARSTSRGRRAR